MASYTQTKDYKDNLEILLSANYHKIVRNGDTVIDGGANGGLHSIPLARLVGPTGTVHAYEPQISSLESLMQYANIERLNSRIVFRQVAIGRNSKTRMFFSIEKITRSAPRRRTTSGRPCVMSTVHKEVMPAMTAVVRKHFWEMSDVVDMLERGGAMKRPFRKACRN
jgi:FkbM family methyltransferase